MTDYVLAAQRFVGIPWVKHGRTHAGADCYGLYLLFAREVLKQNPPDFCYANENTAERRDAIYANMHLFTPVPKDTVGAIITLAYLGQESHVGVYLGSGYMLHSDIKAGSQVVRLADGYMQNTIADRIKGWFTWQEA